MHRCFLLSVCILVILLFAWGRKEKFVNQTRLVTLHYTDWCPHCKVMKPVWDQVIVATKGSGIIFKEVNEDVNKTPGINGIPTIIMIDENGKASKYLSGPDFVSLHNWVVARH